MKGGAEVEVGASCDGGGSSVVAATESTLVERFQSFCNGVGTAWELPAAITGEGVLRPAARGVVLPPLHVGFAVFPQAGVAGCK